MSVYISVLFNLGKKVCNFTTVHSESAWLIIMMMLTFSKSLDGCEFISFFDNLGNS